MCSSQNRARAIVERTGEREPLGSDSGAGNRPRAPLDVANVGKRVQPLRVPEPRGHLGMVRQDELRVAEDVEVERGCGLAVLPATVSWIHPRPQ
jgi:hypothetical protein